MYLAYLNEHDLSGVDISIMKPEDAIRCTMERCPAASNKSVTDKAWDGVDTTPDPYDARACSKPPAPTRQKIASSESIFYKRHNHFQ